MPIPANEAEFYRTLKLLGFRIEGPMIRGLQKLRGHRAFWAEARMIPAKYVLAEYRAWCREKGIPCDDTVDSFCAWLRQQGFTVEPDARGVMTVYGMRPRHSETIEFDKEDLERFAQMQRIGIWPPNMPPMAYDAA